MWWTTDTQLHVALSFGVFLCFIFQHSHSFRERPIPVSTNTEYFCSWNRPPSSQPQEKTKTTQTEAWKHETLHQHEPPTCPINSFCSFFHNIWGWAAQARVAITFAFFFFCMYKHEVMWCACHSTSRWSTMISKITFGFVFYFNLFLENTRFNHPQSRALWCLNRTIQQLFITGVNC